MIVQIIEGGAVANCIVVPDGAVVTSASAMWVGGGYDAPAAATLMAQEGACIGWTLSGSTLVPPVVVAAPTTQASLVSYANARQWGLATGGYTITLTPVGATGPAPVTFPTDTTSLGLIDGKVSRFGHANPPASVNWQTGPTTFIEVSAGDFVSAAAQIADFIQSSFDAVKPILAAIVAGTITTEAQIDAASWPANAA